MIKILIIEDEIPARKKIKRFIEELEASVKIMAELDTVESAVDYLNVYQADLIFSDIELLDGNAFDIYQQVSVACPIIFTTAYDQFWMDAFERNGIDYLLKPFSKERFRKAWDKYLLLSNNSSNATNQIDSLTKLIQQTFQNQAYKKRFTISRNQNIYFLATDDILFFEADEGVVFAIDYQGKKHLLTEPTLKEIEIQVNPSDFFRINRSELVHKFHIEKIERYNKNTLAVKLKGYKTYLKTSQSQTSTFREWVER